MNDVPRTLEGLFSLKRECEADYDHYYYYCDVIIIIWLEFKSQILNRMLNEYFNSNSKCLSLLYL